MKQTELTKACDRLTSNKNLVDSKGKIKMRELNLVFEYGGFNQDDSSEIVAKLSTDGFITIAKGPSTHSSIQRKIVQYFNNQFHEDLMKTCKTSFSITEEEANCLREEEEGIGFDNALGEFIVPKVNNDNITHKRATKKVKAQQQEMEKNMKTRS